MELTEILTIFVPAASAVAVAVIEGNSRKHKKHIEIRAKRRETESLLSMRLMSACVDLAFVTSLAVTGGHTNGNVEAAQKKAREAQKAYDEFIEKEAAHAISKI